LPVSKVIDAIIAAIPQASLEDEDLEPDEEWSQQGRR
jgi:DNA repair protein RadA/Sms